MEVPYVPLHVHSHYSLLDGLSKPKDLIRRCTEMGIKACALTDHGNVFGAMDFYSAAKEAGIKAIIGCEIYVAPSSVADRSGKSSSESAEHLVLYCRNETGYLNLCKLSSLAHLEGWHYKPRVDDDLLAKYSDGLMASTACLGGRIPRLLMKGNTDAADRTVKRYIDIFGADGLFIEMMNHGMPEEDEINPKLADLARRHGLLTVATNDSHYTNRDDAEAHEVLLCIQTQKTLDAPDHMHFCNDEFYFRSPEEMRGLFARWPEAVTNTCILAERCEFQMPKYQQLIPDFAPPEGRTKLDYLTELVMIGLRERYGDPVPASHHERAMYEIKIIDSMNFTDYFLVVWDLIHHARVEKIPVGPGRGSGAGSIVAYALRITNVDPIRYGLLFERFLNPERVSMPDFDIDFCYYRRPDMIEYAKERYGAPNVSQIATFGRMLPRNVVRNVGRVLSMPLREVDRLAKMLPSDPKGTLAKALEAEPSLRTLIQEDSQVGRLWRLAERLEGTINSIGTHAAGVVICDHDLTDHVGLYRPANSSTVITQAEMSVVEKIGLLKMDFLGLRTLTVIHEAVKLVKTEYGIDIDLDNLDLHDAKTYALLRSGHTAGVFQLESEGMRDVARRIGLESIEELSALVALYRPGPMQFIDTFIDCKHHPERVHYDHPILETILKETYGIPVYQEQVMQMVQACAGFSLGRADIVRRAMGKKKKEELDKQKADFVAGCIEQEMTKSLGETLWAKIESFANYGFNKSHSVAYAFVAYQTAYLKANYPVAYMCALLTGEIGDLEKGAEYVEECQRLDIPVLPPDVNHSNLKFKVDGNSVRIGLEAVRNVGEGPAKAIVEERKNGPYKDIYDFCKRLNSFSVNARVIESLNKAGAFLGTGWNRRQVEEVIEKALTEAQVIQRDRSVGQTTLFDGGDDSDGFSSAYQKPNLPEWPDHKVWEAEKEMLGLYISAHPLQNHRDTVKNFTTIDLADTAGFKEGEEVMVAGIVSSVRRITTKKGGRMAFLSLQTLQGPCDITIFTDLYDKKNSMLANDLVIVCICRVNYREDKFSLLAEDILAIDDVETKLTRALHVRVLPPRQQTETLEQLARIITKSPGTCDVYLHCTLPDIGEVIIRAPESCRVTPTRAMRFSIEELMGENTAFCSAGMNLPSHTPPRPRPQQPRWRTKNESTVNDN